MLSLSPLAYDSRVLRHARALADAGYAVTILGEAPLPADAGIPVIELAAAKSDARIRAGLALRHAPAAILPASAPALYWCSATRILALGALVRLQPDLVVANDWRCLPLATAARRFCGARTLYDSHEFATEEAAQSRRWRLLARRHVVEIESRHIRRADAVMTVSGSLARALGAKYGFDRIPFVVPNRPDATPIGPHRTGDIVSVLYHGIVAPGRGLERLVEAAGLWPPHLRLVVRGPVQVGFDALLARLAGASAARVAIEPPVAPRHLIAAAATSDIGIFLLDAGTAQARHVLPNKVSEYIVAGLMPVSSDLPEVRRLFEECSCGLLLPDNRPHTIAEALGSLTPADIDRNRQAAHSASRELTFEASRAVLLEAVETALNGTPRR